MLIVALLTIVDGGHNPGIKKKKMDEQNLEYMYNEILFSHKKEQNLDACYNMDKPCKQKPDTKGYMPYHSTEMRQNIQNR